MSSEWPSADPARDAPIMALYRLTADAVLIMHAAFIAFVVFGLLLVLIGMAARWQWVRNLWFRAAHLLAIAIVVVQSWASVLCPLTTLEGYLRQKGGQPFYAQSFVAHWLHRIVFYQAEPWVFVVCYSVFGALVLVTWIACPPRWPRRGVADAGPPVAPKAMHHE